MSKVDELVINYAIYEDATEYLGTTEVTLPDLEYMTEELSGAGIAGNIEEIIIGHLCHDNNFQFPNRNGSSGQVNGTPCA